MSNLTKNPVLIKAIIDRWLEKEISSCIEISNTLKTLKITVDHGKGSGGLNNSRSFPSLNYQLWQAPQKKSLLKCVSERKPAFLSNTEVSTFLIESTHIGIGKLSSITSLTNLISGSQSSMDSIEKRGLEVGKLGISTGKRMSFLIRIIFKKFNFNLIQFLGVKYLKKYF